MKRTRFQKKRLQNARQAGFTLIELMVVLMLITLLSSMIVPSVASAMRRGGIDRTALLVLEQQKRRW